MNKQTNRAPARQHTPRGVGAKSLIAVSSLTLTVGGWAYLSTDALRLDAQAAATAVAQETATAEALPTAPVVTFDALPTVAALDALQVDVDATPQVQVQATPRPAAQAAAPKPRRIRTKAVTRSSR